MTHSLNVGIIGCGNIGASAHLPAYAKISDAQLLAVCDVVEERARDAAEASGATPYLDYHQLLDSGGLDTVDLCVPTDLHAPIAIEAMHAGLHVLCEKPMAHNLEAASAMIEAAKANSVKLMIGHVRRFDHRYAIIKEQLDGGEVGRVAFIRRSERQFLPHPADAWLWDRDRGGGVILDIGVHVTDLFRWYFGREAVEVYAVGKFVREVANQTGSYDHAMITCRFEGGGVGFAEVSWAYPPGFGGALYAHLDVVGTQGKIQYADKDTNPMLTHTAEKGHELPRYFRFMSTTEYAFEEEIRHFVRCVLEDREPSISPADARAALEMSLAARLSADTRQPVALPLRLGADS